MRPRAKPDAEPALGREIVSTRRLPAPRATVFAAFSDPRRLAVWWGPHGFTSTIHEFDLRPGGQWRMVIHGPDGASYDQAKEFITVNAPEEIVFRHRQVTHGFRMTMTFATEGEGTRLIWRMLFDSAEEGDRVREIVAVANEENFDRLEQHLANTKSKEDYAPKK